MRRPSRDDLRGTTFGGMLGRALGGAHHALAGYVDGTSLRSGFARRGRFVRVQRQIRLFIAGRRRSRRGRGRRELLVTDVGAGSMKANANVSHGKRAPLYRAAAFVVGVVWLGASPACDDDTSSAQEGFGQGGAANPGEGGANDGEPAAARGPVAGNAAAAGAGELENTGEGEDICQGSVTLTTRADYEALVARACREITGGLRVERLSTLTSLSGLTRLMRRGCRL